MSPALLIAGIVLGGGLWPFGGDDTNRSGDTIADLKPREVELKMQPTVPDNAALARQQYREFVSIAEGHPGLQTEAMRRLADLNVAAGEEAGVDGAGDAVFYAEAVDLYARLLSANPDYAQRDLILYQLGRAHEATGDNVAALAVLDQLVATHPDSHYYDEAQFRRGEIMFVDKRYHEAELAYAQVIASGEASPYYQQSLYKQGWSLFKLGLHEESLESFMSLLDLQLADGDGSNAALDALSRPQRELIDDTTRVLAISFTYMDGEETLNQLLSRRGEPVYANLLYARLGELYLDKERYTDAAETYAAFVARAPAHEASPGLQQRVIEAYTLGRFPSLVLAAKEDYVGYYGLDAAFWSQREPADYPAVVAELKQHLSDLAAYDHSEAQAGGGTPAYERAADWYRRYLAYFPDDPDSAQRSFLLAEILNELGRYGEATDQYLDAAYAYGPHPQAAEAAYAAVLGARRHEAQLEGDVLAAWHARALDDALMFAERFPEHEQAGPVRVTVAEEYFAGGELQRAVEVSGLVVTMQPPVSMELERTAWTVMAHSQFDLGRYADAERAYGRLQLLPAADTLPPDAIEARIAASVYRQGELARDAGDVDVAVAQFLRVAEAAPGSDIVPTAAYDAAALLINAGRWEAAVPVLEDFQGSFAGHALGDDVSQKLAVARRESGQPAEAAAEFERIATLASVDVNTQREALWEAADLYALAAQPADERRVYARIVERFPAPLAEAIEARQKLADLAAAADDLADRNRWLEAIVQADATGLDARTERTRTLAARASLELAAPLRDAFYAARLVAPLKDSLKLKKLRMEQALAAYGSAADYGVAEVTTAATFEIGELYYGLSTALIDSERPADLDADALEQYEVLVEEQAFPFEEQAIEIFTANAGRAADGVYDEWVRRSFRRLAELMPARYAKTERRETLVAQID